MTTTDETAVMKTLRSPASATRRQLHIAAVLAGKLPTAVAQPRDRLAVATRASAWPKCYADVERIDWLANGGKHEQCEANCQANCLFRALSFAIYSDAHFVALLRRVSARFMLANASAFEQVSDEFCLRVELGRVEGTFDVLRALASVYARRVNVLMSTGELVVVEPIVGSSVSESEPPLFIGHLCGAHYCGIGVKEQDKTLAKIVRQNGAERDGTTDKAEHDARKGYYLNRRQMARSEVEAEDKRRVDLRKLQENSRQQLERKAREAEKKQNEPELVGWAEQLAVLVKHMHIPPVPALAAKDAGDDGEAGNEATGKIGDGDVEPFATPPRITVLVVGRSGAGKSTFVNAVFGLQPPGEGNVSEMNGWRMEEARPKPGTGEFSDVSRCYLCNGVYVTVTFVDSPGLTLAESQQGEVKTTVLDHIRDGLSGERPHIDCLLYFISTDNKAETDIEFPLMASVSQFAPVIPVRARCDALLLEVQAHWDEIFAESCKQLPYSPIASSLVCILAKEDEVPIEESGNAWSSDEDDTKKKVVTKTIPPTNLVALMKCIARVSFLWHPFQQTLLANFASTAETARKWRIRSTSGIILTFSTMAGGTGAIPVPFVDNAALIVIAGFMMKAINMKYWRVKLPDGAAGKLIWSAFSSGGNIVMTVLRVLKFVVIDIVFDILKVFPLTTVVGIVGASTINFAYMLVLGLIYRDALERLYKENILQADLKQFQEAADVAARDLRKKSFDEKLAEVNLSRDELQARLSHKGAGADERRGA